MRAPSATEFEMHCALVEALAKSIMPGWWWSHLPAGEKRDKVTAARLQRMGLRPGLPDFIFIGPGRVFFLELKRPGGAASDEQANVALHIIRSGCGYLCTDNLDDAIGTLRDLGIVRARVSA